MTAKIATQTELKRSEDIKNLVSNYCFLQWPFDKENTWTPLDTEFENYGIDARIGRHFLQQEGIINDTGAIAPDVIKYGLFLAHELTDAEGLSGYSEKVQLDLVSKRGRKFLEEFFATHI